MFGSRKTAEFARAQSALAAQQVALIEAQNRQLDIFSKFLETLADLTTKRAASLMAIRSNKVRVAKKQAARAGAARDGCGLCSDPFRKDVTVEMISQHRTHETASVPEPSLNGFSKGET